MVDAQREVPVGWLRLVLCGSVFLKKVDAIGSLDWGSPFIYLPEERPSLEGREEEGLIEHDEGRGAPRDEGAEREGREARLEDCLEPRLKEEPRLWWW